MAVRSGGRDARCRKSLFPICGDSGPILGPGLHGDVSTSGGKDLGLWEVPHAFLPGPVPSQGFLMLLCLSGGPHPHRQRAVKNFVFMMLHSFKTGNSANSDKVTEYSACRLPRP